MAKISDLVEKRTVNGTEQLAVLDGDVTKSVPISAITDKVAESIAERQVNLSSDPVAFTKSFVADQDLVSGDGVTLYRDGSQVKAKKIGTGVITKEVADVPQKDLNLAEFDIRLDNIYWTTNQPNRDLQLSVLPDDEENTDSSRIKVFQNNPTIQEWLVISDTEVVILGYASNITRVLDLGYEIESGAVVVGDEDLIINATGITQITQRITAFICVFKFENEEWTASEAVGVPLTRANKALVNTQIEKGIHAAYFNDFNSLSSLGDNTFRCNTYAQNSNPFGSSTYSNNTLLNISDLHSTSRNINFRFKIIDSKVKLLYEDQHGYYSNFLTITSSDFENLSATEKLFWNTDYDNSFIKLDDDLEGSRNLIAARGTNGSSYSTFLIERFSVDANNQMTSVLEEFQGGFPVAGRNISSYSASSSGGFINQLFKTEEGDFIIYKDRYSYRAFELKDNQSYFLGDWNSSLHRYPTKQESFVDHSINSVSLGEIISPNPLNFIYNFISSGIETIQSIYRRAYDNPSNYRVINFYKSAISYLTSTEETQSLWRSSGESSQYFNDATNMNSQLHEGAYIYRYRDTELSSTYRLRYNSVLAASSLVSTGQNDTLIGFATADAVAGASVGVAFISQGTILSFFNNLVTGRTYYFDAVAGLNYAVAGKLLGLAISPTELVVQNG